MKKLLRNYGFGLNEEQLKSPEPPLFAKKIGLSPDKVLLSPKSPEKSAKKDRTQSPELNKSWNENKSPTQGQPVDLERQTQQSLITDKNILENLSVPIDRIENLGSNPSNNQLDISSKDKSLKSPTYSLASRLNLRNLENLSLLLHQLSYLSYELIENK